MKIEFEKKLTDLKLEYHLYSNRNQPQEQSEQVKEAANTELMRSYTRRTQDLEESMNELRGQIIERVTDNALKVPSI